jgi:hypothetical protein
MIYLAAKNQPEGITPFRLEKEQSRSGWEIAIAQGGQRFGTTLSSVGALYSVAMGPTIHVSFMQRFTSVNAWLDARPCKGSIQSFDTPYRKICATNSEVTGIVFMHHEPRRFHVRYDHCRDRTFGRSLVYIFSSLAF